jgi:hypothetical protein
VVAAQEVAPKEVAPKVAQLAAATTGTAVKVMVMLEAGAKEVERTAEVR